MRHTFHYLTTTKLAKNYGKSLTAGLDSHPQVLRFFSISWRDQHTLLTTILWNLNRREKSGKQRVRQRLRHVKLCDVTQTLPTGGSQGRALSADKTSGRTRQAITEYLTPSAWVFRGCSVFDRKLPPSQSPCINQWAISCIWNIYKVGLGFSSAWNIFITHNLGQRLTPPAHRRSWRARKGVNIRAWWTGGTEPQCTGCQ